MAPNIESYEQFELEMDRALKEPFDAEGTLTYLKKHASSKRAEELKTVIGEFL